MSIVVIYSGNQKLFFIQFSKGILESRGVNFSPKRTIVLHTDAVILLQRSRNQIGELLWVSVPGISHDTHPFK